MKGLVFLALLSLVSLGQSQTVSWPNSFYFNHTETWVKAPGVAVPGYFAVNLDPTNEQLGQEVVYRSDGSLDHICGPLGNNLHTDCAQIVTQGWRYIVHPSLGKCCRCCSNKNGCGALGSFWVDGAVYSGTTTIAGTPSYHWNITGDSVNSLYLAVNDSRVTEITNGDLDIFTADMTTYSDSVNQNLFTIPDGCDDNPCPKKVFPCGLANEDEKDFDPLTEEELNRAIEWNPSNAYKGDNLPHASDVLNGHLDSREDLKTRACSKWTLADLDIVQGWMASKANPDLLAIYKDANDPRQDKEGSYEEIWEKMREIGAESSLASQMLTMGRCRQSVMWFVHHLSSKFQQEFIKLGLVLPRLPTQDEEVEIDEDEVAKLTEGEQWAFKVGVGLQACEQCHI